MNDPLSWKEVVRGISNPREIIKDDETLVYEFSYESYSIVVSFLKNLEGDSPLALVSFLSHFYELEKPTKKELTDFFYYFRLGGEFEELTKGKRMKYINLTPLVPTYDKPLKYNIDQWMVEFECDPAFIVAFSDEFENEGYDLLGDSDLDVENFYFEEWEESVVTKEGDVFKVSNGENTLVIYPSPRHPKHVQIRHIRKFKEGGEMLVNSSLGYIDECLHALVNGLGLERFDLVVCPTGGVIAKSPKVLLSRLEKEQRRQADRGLTFFEKHKRAFNEARDRGNPFNVLKNFSLN